MAFGSAVSTVRGGTSREATTSTISLRLSGYWLHFRPSMSSSLTTHHDTFTTATTTFTLDSKRLFATSSAHDHACSFTDTSTLIARRDSVIRESSEFMDRDDWRLRCGRLNSQLEPTQNERATLLCSGDITSATRKDGRTDSTWSRLCRLPSGRRRRILPTMGLAQNADSLGSRLSRSLAFSFGFM